MSADPPPQRLFGMGTARRTSLTNLGTDSRVHGARARAAEIVPRRIGDGFACAKQRYSPREALDPGPGGLHG